MAKWSKVTKKTPEDDRQVFALSGRGVFLSFYRDGDWWLTNTITLGDVTKWMEVPGEPKDFDYWVRELKKWWASRKQNAHDAKEYIIGWPSRNAQIRQKVVYFHNERTGEIRMGLPEHFPASKGFNKVVCTSAYEAERWSSLLRKQNVSKEERVNEERERIEGPIRDQIRSNMYHVMSNSRNNINREFVKRYMEKMDKIPSKTQREEYLHSEGYEKGR